MKLKVFVFLISLFTLHLSLFTSSAHAQEAQGCQVRQEREDGIYLCMGGIFGDECVYDPNLDPPCEKISETPADGGTTPSTTTPPESSTGYLRSDTGESISTGNYKAPQHSNYTIINLQHSLFCELAGMSPVDKCIGIDANKQLALYDRVPGGGAIGGLTNFTAALYNPPTSSAQYLANLGENLGLVKPVYAQDGGSGAGIINPVLSLWQVSRNIAYIAFILVFVAVGVMIMLRSRINPQTVIGIQQALPGLIIGLILVTFSYFIAALLIDLAFLGIQVAAQIFLNAQTVEVKNFFPIQNWRENSNVFQMFLASIRLPQNFADLFGGTLRTLFSAGGEGVGGGVVVLMPAIIGAIIGTIIFPGAGTLIGAAIGGATPAIIGLIVPLILIIVLLIQFFRLLWQLITAYISLLVGTVTGPFIILFASIPGRGGVLGLWWKTILGNALVFPAVFAAFLFAGLILGTPPKSWIASPPLFGGLSTELLRLILAYGIILGTPAIPGMVRRALGVPEIQGIPQEAIGGMLSGFALAQATSMPLGRGALTTFYSRYRTFPVGTWQRNLAQTIYNRYGGQPQRHPWFGNQPAPP